MARLCVAFAALLLSFACSPAWARQDAQRLMDFEAADPAALAAMWFGFPPGTVAFDSAVTHEGRWAGRLRRAADSEGTFSALSRSFPMEFTGDTLELRGWLRLEGVVGWAGLWFRQDSTGGVVQFDNMQSRGLDGTREWAEYRIKLPLDPRAKTLVIGALLTGIGTVWVDDVSFHIDGKPLAALAAAEPNAAATDKEFVTGSRIELSGVTPAQIDNLAILGRVWGYLKYHHPAVVAGKHHWDFELFRVLPAVLVARDRNTAVAAINAWVTRLGPVERCEPCARLPAELALHPDLAWLEDRDLLGARLSRTISQIHARRRPVRAPYYVTQFVGVGNPSFDNESPMPEGSLPDAGYRLLALFRYWNMIEYWFPYRDVIGSDWRRVLTEYVPRVIAAGTQDDYALVMMDLIARVQDTHANLWSHLQVRPPRGDANLPVALRFIERRAVVAGYSHRTLGPATGLRPGDAIVAVDGRSVDSLVAERRVHYAASNEPTRLRDMARVLARGPLGPVRLTVERDGATREVTVERVLRDSLDRTVGATHDLAGETFQRLSPDVAYLKLSSVKVADCAEYTRKAEGARLLVVDARNYPSDFVVFALGQHLAPAAREFVRFTVGQLDNPGAFMLSPPLTIQPMPPTFAGRVAILVDEITQSSAEYTSMAFRSAPGAIVVGSTTAGADGNVSRMPLPGGLHTMISGIGVFYPDGRPTQRVGIVPDVEVPPTLAGFRAGRDEVLEAAIRAVLAREPSAEERAAVRGQ